MKQLPKVFVDAFQKGGTGDRAPPFLPERVSKATKDDTKINLQLPNLAHLRVMQPFMLSRLTKFHCFEDLVLAGLNGQLDGLRLMVKFDHPQCGVLLDHYVQSGFQSRFHLNFELRYRV